MSIRPRIAIIATLMTGSATLPAANAGSFYVETSAGFSQFRSGTGFFGSGIPDSTDFGFGMNGGFFWNFSPADAPTQFHVGLQDRLASSASGTTNASIQAPYVVLRAQLSKMYVGIGISPMVWRRVMDNPSLANFSKAPDTYAGLIETGLLWAVTSEFTLGTSLGTQWISANGTLGPRPAVDGMALMRFYFGFYSGSSGGGAKTSGEFKGWRYPLGQELR